MASLFVVTSTEVIFLIANHSTGQVCTPFKETEPSSYLAPTLPGRPVRVSGATGEWITERPVNWTTGQPDNLPFFERVVFEDCLVVLGRGRGADEWEERPCGTLLINATTVDTRPLRTVTVARAKRHRRKKFSITFVGVSSNEPGGIVKPGSASAPTLPNNR